MILRQFPGHDPSLRRGPSGFAYFHQHNVIVHARSRHVAYAEHTAPLSLKTTLRGREVYEVNGAILAVEEDTYLILNHEQPYASYIEATDEVESFCLFFRDELAREAARLAFASHEQLLDDPQTPSTQAEPFFQYLCRNNARLISVLARLQTAVVAEPPEVLWLDEQFHELMEAMLGQQRELRLAREALPAVRRATREELFRRLHRAKDYLESFYAQSLPLAELAQVACLSPHHFLRLFKQAFGFSPHQYLTHIRLEKARRLLTERDCSITETLHSVGFENASAFARLFKRRFGCSPRQVRRPAK